MIDLIVGAIVWLMFRTSRRKDIYGRKWICTTPENRLRELILRRWSASGRCHKGESAEQNENVTRPMSEIYPEPHAPVSGDRIQQYIGLPSPPRS